jgi:hypothetical protein
MVTQFSGIYVKLGNSKLGRSIGTINRAAVETCPGASPKCLEICYAMKGRSYMQQPRYKIEIIGLPAKLPKAVRFHASGDFDSIHYIEWAIDLVKNNPDTKFWSYTKSWRVPELLPALEQLRALSNMQLFASMDDTILESPPNDWRIAYITGDDRYKYAGPLCMYQAKTKSSCAECQYCFVGTSKNIGFDPH